MSKKNNTDHPLYNTWRKIKEKHHCNTNPITMCLQWLNSFHAFLHDVGERPGVNYYLKRLYMDKEYSKKNYQWKVKNITTQHTHTHTHTHTQVVVHDTKVIDYNIKSYDVNMPDLMT